MASDMKLKILSAANQGGSGRGISFYTQVSKCPRKANLNAANGDSGYGARVGTLIHGILEIYYAPKEEEGSSEDTESSREEP
jgi:hypothetical protein